ncbi:Longitudinals lacking protein, isoforms A/B/D/L [Frankliniella fusca]|uniref:Longitudinals lacking protein, isoforms A/B/D/L n=1 Tax=Frankliniella fusca TaxID=407009 RepID=A0AAE1H6F9_9NEOP|nr:Longitudinals lacking protein, isoforms A/B/D/L [Frankliniella fusca]
MTPPPAPPARLHYKPQQAVYVQSQSQGQGQSTFPCMQCGKVYLHLPSLWNHKAYQCGKEPQFPCRVCNRRFKFKAHCKRHLLKQHGLVDVPTQRQSRGFQGLYGHQGIQDLQHGFPSHSAAGIQVFPGALQSHLKDDTMDYPPIVQEDFFDNAAGFWPGPLEVQDLRNQQELDSEMNEGLEDPEDTAGRFRDIFQYLAYRKYPANVVRNQRSNFRKCTKSFIVHNGLLYHKTKLSVVRGAGKDVPRYVVVVPNRLKRSELMRLAHQSAPGDPGDPQCSSAHRGINATVQLLDRRYWWPNITGDVKNFCRSCLICNVQKVSASKWWIDPDEPGLQEQLALGPDAAVLHDATPELGFDDELIDGQASEEVRGAGEPGAEFACKMCHKKYVNYQSLWKHTKFNCGNAFPAFQCPLCTVRCRRRDTLKRHMTKFHGPESRDHPVIVLQPV